MRVEGANQTGFTSLYRGGSIKRILESGQSKKFASGLRKVENSIRKNNLHKKENVDIILGYSKTDGFYGIISSKTQGTPMNPASECKISNDKESVNKFTEWVNAWNDAYSPEELNKFRNLMNFIKNGFKKE